MGLQRAGLIYNFLSSRSLLSGPYGRNPKSTLDTAARAGGVHQSFAELLTVAEEIDGFLEERAVEGLQKDESVEAGLVAPGFDPIDVVPREI